MRTARSRTSGENLFDFVMAPSSQTLEPPQFPGRFSHCLEFNRFGTQRQKRRIEVGHVLYEQRQRVAFRVHCDEEHLQLLAPELPARVWDGLFDNLLQLQPLDWPQACSVWFAGLALDAMTRQSLEELLFAWAVEQHMRRLCAGYTLPTVKVRPHCWWAAQPTGRAALLEAGLEQVQGRAAAHRLIEADHQGIVRHPQVLSELARLLASE